MFFNKTILKKIVLILAFSFISISAESNRVSAENSYKWQRFAGNWIINNSILEEKQIWANPWYYYELLNFNTLMSYKNIKSYNSLSFKFTASKPDIEIKTIDKEPALMAAFNIRSPYKAWYFHMFAIKIIGNSDYLEKISLVFSDRIDKTKKYSVKHNTFVKELASRKIKLEYGKEYSLKINLVGNSAIVIIDRKKVLNSKMSVSEHGGRIALSSKNIVFKVRNVNVYNNNDVVFSDDFSQDTIYIPRVRARRVKK